MLRTGQFQTVAQAEQLAKRRLPRPVWLALKAGCEAGWTLDDNVRAFSELGFSPTVFDWPASIDIRTKVLGVELDMPVIIAPAGAQAVHPDGEVGAAAAAKRHGTAMGLSTWASDSLADTLRVNPNMFFQLYWVGTRAQIQRRVEDALQQGAKALILTLDWSFTPRRDWCVPPKPPVRMDLRTMASLAPEALARPAWLASFLRRGSIPATRVPNLWGEHRGEVPTFGSAWAVYEKTPPATLEDVKWLRSLWTGPMLIKGINTIHDAQLCVDLGADAISVSNHGGNNIDGSPAPIRYLPAIVDAVGSDIDVMVDGGVRRGSDVVKALALGAKAVFLGRAYLYGLAVGGEEGVYRILDIVRSGIKETMFGIGRSSIGELSREDLVVLNRDFFVSPAR